MIASACCVILVVLGAGCDRGGDEQQTPVAAETPRDPEPVAVDELLTAAGTAWQRGATDPAWDLVQRVLVREPDNAEGLALATSIQRGRGQYAAAAELADQAAAADPSMLTKMMMIAFDCHLRMHQFDAAEEALKRAAEQDPDNPEPHRYLGQLLNAQGRRVEASHHVRELIRLRRIQPNELLSLVDLRGPFLLASFDPFVDKNQTSLFQVGEIRFLYSTERTGFDEMLDRLGELVIAFPNSTTAAALRVRMLADLDRFDELRASLSKMPDGIEVEPEYWFALGVLLASDDRHDEAARAFTEALARDPTDRESLRSMIASFVATERSEETIKLRERLGELDKIFRIAREATSDEAIWISKTLQSHVRPWESSAWLMQAARISGSVQSVIPELDRRLDAISQWQQNATVDQLVDARLNSFLGFTRDRWPMPDIERLATASTKSKIKQAASTIRMTDVAEQAGIATQFESGFPLDGGKFALHEVNGGGLAVLDYDLDGLCDVYVMQSGGHPEQPNSSQPNQLFRLVPGDRFEDVSKDSGAQDRRFGQGVCVGDVNQDGFPDLLLANIGTNGVYLNQGDGTFAAADDLLLDNPAQWTSSLGLADLDGDHLPEIVEINYVDDPNAYSVRCRENYLECQPQEFGKCQDRVLLGRRDGSFAKWDSFTDSSPVARLGFGLVIANFDRQHGNDFFLSNDGDFNHFWISTQSTERPGQFELIEAANVRGCSVGRGGRSQACMGIASGDFDRNGTLDLHVTNFRNEPVNLFLQSDSGVFVDRASAYGLAKPSLGVLGFGTQAADLDNDGWLDLTVLNGHVYDA